jgi:hypothetical protein
MTAVTVIISEATTMNDYPHNACADEQLRTSAATNAVGTLIIALVSSATWIIGLFETQL